MRRAPFDPLVETVAAAGASIATHARCSGIAFGELREKHLQAAFETVAPLMYATYDRQVSARSERVDWPEFPGVGAVDVVLGGNGYPIFIELKWCYKPEKLAEAVWDLVKLSIPLSKGACAGSVLAYAAPHETWSTARGGELFTAGAWAISDLRNRYIDWWRYWQKAVKARPVQVPDTLSTLPVTVVEFPSRGGETWELRAIEINDATDCTTAWHAV